MNGWFDKADQWLGVLGPNPYVHAVALILIFLVIAHRLTARSDLSDYCHYRFVTGRVPDRPAFQN